MSTAARKRLIRDFKRLQQDPPEGVNASPQAENIMQWNALMFGPDGTVWDGGVFKLSMEFSEDYPNKAPVVKFTTRMFHPNSARPCLARRAAGWCCWEGGRRATCRARSTSPHPHPHPLLLFLAVYADGGICLDILQNQWSPIYDVSAILTSIQSLLSDPNPNSPANSEVE